MAFQRKGPVSGSWIYIHPNEYEKNGLIYDTYRGGITRTIDDQQKQFEFHADVKTGVVIDVQQTERSEEHTSELQSRGHLVCRLLLEKKKKRCSQYKII